MIFAIIPWDKRFEKNVIFDVDDVENRNGLTPAYLRMKKRFNALGHEINTIDCYNNLNVVDYFLFFDFFEEWIITLTRMGLDSKMIYCNAEPPTVKAINSPEGFNKLKKIFPYIMTWNKDLVDNKRVFWRTIPYVFSPAENDVPYEQKKLLTSISANKKSNYVNEIYSTREELISYFEKAIPEQFDMYGTGWDKSGHSSYRGRAKDKAETYSNYKFALALENTRNVKGYVTEKIFDCLTSGIVPVYLGADDICDYVSPDCFIDYRNYENPKKLHEYLLSVDREEYERYLLAAQKCIASEDLKHLFSGEMYADNILYLAENCDLNDFKANKLVLMFINLKKVYIEIKRFLIDKMRRLHVLF